MSIKLFAPLAVAGSGLVASNSMWFFVSEEETSKPTPSIAPKPIVYVNSLPPSPKIERKGSVVTDQKIIVGQFIPRSGVYWKFRGDEKQYYMSILQVKIPDFVLNFVATKDDYLKFDKKKINISLFTNPAWYSGTNVDEYEKKLEPKQIEELFGDGLDEAKVKQLLLSLGKRRNWKKTDVPTPITYWSYIEEPRSIDILSDLKIKYFRDFSDLKSYVHEKVKSCVGDDTSCVANVEELDFMDTDKLSYFDQFSQN